jgi:hypothetical protein
VQDGEAVLGPAEKLNLKQLVRTFTLRTSEGFVENFGPDLIARVGEEAPGVRLFFVQKSDEDSTPLRDGIVHLETTVQECSSFSAGSLEARIGREAYSTAEYEVGSGS